MSEKIHENREAAKEACEKYIAAIANLKNEIGVFNENDEHKAAIGYICAWYYNENGEVEMLWAVQNH